MMFDFTPNPNDNLYERVQSAEYVCIANSFEVLSLWKMWHNEYGNEWLDERDGRGIIIGKCTDGPVFLSLSWATVKGIKVMFVDPTSRFIDYTMVDEWLQEHCNGARTDHSKFIQQSDAMNFGPSKPVRSETNKLHVSFDVWNTLIKGNPEFSKKRIGTIMDHWNLPAATFETVKQAYTNTKRTLDWMAEKHGTAYNCLTIYDMLSDALGVGDSDKDSLEVLRLKVERDFLAYPPIVIDGVHEALSDLRDAGYTLSIGSNSNFISGSTMFPWLRDTLGYFDFGVFSDLEEVAKPNTLFFAYIASRARNKCNVKNSNDIIHVGDHEICDVHGALKAEMTPFLVTKELTLPTVVENILKGQK